MNRLAKGYPKVYTFNYWYMNIRTFVVTCLRFIFLHIYCEKKARKETKALAYVQRNQIDLNSL